MTRHHIFDPSGLAMKGLGPKLRAPRTPDALAGMPGLAGGSVQWTPPSPGVPLSVADGRDSKSVRGQPHVEIAVCQGKKCSKAGSGALLAAFRREAEGSSAVVVRPCKCRDACKAAPVVEITSGAGKVLVKVRAHITPLAGVDARRQTFRELSSRRPALPQRVHTSQVMRLLATHIADADIEDSATPECSGGAAGPE